MAHNFTLPYLESLSTGSLLDLADKCALDIPFGLERVFIIEELLYIDRNRADKPDEFEEGEFEEFAVLLKQYNISFIDVIIRDPLWAFAFWEIKVYDRKLYENAADFGGYCLRVIPMKDQESNRAASFTVPLNADDSGRYLSFPPESGRSFKLELCALRGEHCLILAESRPFTLPCPIEPKSQTVQAVYKNPLAQLSGVEHFSLIHSEDRIPCPRGI